MFLSGFIPQSSQSSPYFSRVTMQHQMFPLPLFLQWTSLGFCSCSEYGNRTGSGFMGGSLDVFGLTIWTVRWWFRSLSVTNQQPHRVHVYLCLLFILPPNSWVYRFSLAIQSFWDSPFCGKGSRNLSSSASSRWSSSSISAHVELTVKFVIVLVLFQFV